MKRIKKRNIYLAFACCLLLGSGLAVGVRASTAPEEVPEKAPVIIAHRAGASFAPENTVAALEQAILDGAEIAEVDIQQLQDGTLIVMHDSDFKRTAGVQRNVWEVDYERMKDINSAAQFRGVLQGETIPTLDQMLSCAQNRIRLMIEVKYTGHEQDIELKLTELLHVFDMVDQCVIGSMNLGILQKVKEIDSMLETVYIAHDLAETDYELDYVDAYSIKLQSLTQAMVNRIREQGKPVYGWTANSRQGVKTIIDLGADGIVTDNVPMAQSYLNQRYQKSLLQIFTGWIF